MSSLAFPLSKKKKKKSLSLDMYTSMYPVWYLLKHWLMVLSSSLCPGSRKLWTACVWDSVLPAALTSMLYTAIFFCPCYYAGTLLWHQHHAFNYAQLQANVSSTLMHRGNNFLRPWESKQHYRNNCTHVCLGFCWNFFCLLLCTLLSTIIFCFTFICTNWDSILEKEHNINYLYVFVCARHCKHV